ncbi:hypothetical protein [Gluconobacter frateurii]|uniref:Uncharacterized protein n=1 Tax=Gluconobacter frateurii NRIC 0228 TaxID=1307946 RepID=A0ABQ0Q922_9PROT|nr:hypothetical protein [Gluconobacter frateurii]GBR09555.1 hypothetical protein AA0228_0716 [Gluconobacter frateurii NRIC 0228]GLP91921.1 hypothetical protein GCM10007868_29960 [Gluconobacter frateurii]
MKGQRCLGGAPARLDPRMPLLSQTSKRVMAKRAPERLPRTGINPAPLLLGNDRLGNCSAVGVGNSIRATAALNGFQVSVREADAVAFYSASTGYVPGDEATDLGGDELSVLTHASRQGFSLASQTLFPVFGTADFEDLNAVRNVIAGMDCSYAGFALAKADQAAGVWDTQTAGDQTPASWGYHCGLIWSWDGTADDDLVTILTWGMEQKATWRWVRSRLTEAHGLLWRQLLPPAKVQDWGTLIEANQEFLSAV